MAHSHINNFVSHGICWHPEEPLPIDIASILPPLHKPVRSQPVGRGNSPRKPYGNPCQTPPEDRFQPVASTLQPHPTSPGGKIAIPAPQKALLTPLHASVTGQIIQDSAQINVSQFFHTDPNLPVSKGVFTFPLPSGCTVTGFNCRVGTSKILKGKVKPREQAAEAFGKAIDEDRTAALLVQNSPDVFTASLGNIAADTKVRIDIRYLVSLKTRVGTGGVYTTELIIPTDIGPRYGPPPDGIMGPVLEARSIDLDLEILDAEGVDISSLTHEVTVETSQVSTVSSGLASLVDTQEKHGPLTARITLRQGSPFRDTDMVLTMEKNQLLDTGLAQPTAWLEIHPTIEKQMALMVEIPQSLLMQPKVPADYGEVMFIADRSGSMKGNMAALKSALHFFLKGIPLGRSFNLWSFGSSHESLWRESSNYNESSLNEALQYLNDGFDADMGGTELLSAVQAAAESRNANGKPCDIIILTDGEVWRLEETLDYIARVRRESSGALRFFSLGIGPHVSPALVEGIATHGGGYSEIISKSDSGGWEDRVVSMLRAALSKRIGPVTLDLGNGHVPDQLVQSPPSLGLVNTFQDFNPFQRPRIYSLLTSQIQQPPHQISLRINSEHGEGTDNTYNVPVIETKGPAGLIHGLAARAILSDVELRQEPNPAITVATNSGFNEEVSSTNAEEFACKYSLLSKWTSFFLEEEERKKDDTDAFMGVQVGSHLAPFGIENALHTPRGYELDKSTGQSPTSNNGRESLFCRLVSEIPASTNHDTDPGSLFSLPFGKRRSSASIPNTNSLQLECGKRMRFSSNASGEAGAAAAAAALSRDSRFWDVDEQSCSYADIDDVCSSVDFEWFDSETTYDSRDRMLSIPDYHELPRSISFQLRHNSPHQPDEGFMSCQSACHRSGPPDKLGDFAKQMTTMILGYQQFDGSLDVALLQELGPKVVDATEKLTNLIVARQGIPTSPHKVSLAVIASILLTRDLSDASAYWELMKTKIEEYIRGAVAFTSIDSEWLDKEATALLRDVRLEADPARTGPASRGGNEAQTEGTEMTADSQDNVTAVEVSERVELDCAPLF